MGRTAIIPTHFDDQRIRFRIPYSMGGEQTVEANESGVFFDDATFLVNVDKPFEAWRMIVRLTALDEQDKIVVPQPADLEKRVRLKIHDTSKNEDMTKASQLVATLISSREGGDGSWEWYVPYTMVRSEGFGVSSDVLELPAGSESVRVEISFEGYLLVIKPPSETR